MPSIFSRIISGELPAFKVAEDAHHLAFLDITPLVEGHTLVIPKKEVDYIFDLPAAELAALHQFAQRVAKGLKKAVPSKRIGVAVIGLEVPHAHIHLIPMQRVSDMNFANPKIKVPEARMQELAAAIAAKVDGGSGLDEAPDKGGAKANESGKPDEGLQQLQQLTKGLHFVSESEAALEAVSFEASAGELSNAKLLKLVGEPADAIVETVELTQFLRNHTNDDGVLGDPNLANRYKGLQMFMKQELEGTKVYRVGNGPQVHAYALGTAASGKLVGFKTVLTET
jgi:histidine triad (HIT) family protein